MCGGAAGSGVGAIICEGWDEAVEFTIVDCLDVDTRVTMVGVVLLPWELATHREGCCLEGQMAR